MRPTPIATRATLAVMRASWRGVRRRTQRKLTTSYEDQPS